MSNRSGFVPIGVGVVIAILAISGAIGAFVFSDRLTFWKDDPEKVLAHAWEQALQAVGAHAEGDIAVRVRMSADETPVDVQIEYASAWAGADDARRAEGDLSIHGTSEELGTLNARISSRRIGERQYLRLDDVDISSTLPQATMLQAVIGGFKGILGGQWIVIDPQALARSGLLSGDGMAALPSSPFVLEEETRAFLLEHPILVFEEQLGKERVDGVRSYHYRVQIDGEAVREFFNFVLTRGTFGATDSATQETLTAVSTELLPVLEHIHPEVWIGRNDEQFVQLRIPVDYTSTKTDASIVGEGVFHWSAWNDSVAVSDPETSLPLESLLALFSSGDLSMFGGLHPAADSQRVFENSVAAEVPVPSSIPNGSINTTLPGNGDADGDGLTDLLELFYGSNPTLPDTDGDGYLDGDEVDHGYSPTGTGLLFPNP
ncbi:MAG: hypothetical protein ABIG71_04530 [Candidatus Uhrbacteria bacterium]